MMYWISQVFKKSLDFDGRSRRSEFWYFYLFTVIVNLVATILYIAVGGQLVADYNIGLLSSLFRLAILLPFLAVSVRRLHDIDRSGWLLLIILIPLLGALILLSWFVSNGTQGPNQYGEDPKKPLPSAPNKK